MYLITGVAGFIGFHLARRLLNDNKKVIGIDNLNSYYSVKFKKERLKLLKKNKNFKFFKIDLSKKIHFKKLKKYYLNIDVIIHLAGQAGVRYSIKNPTTYILNNPYAYLNLLECFKKSEKLKLVLYASSSSVFGDILKKKNKNKPISVYAASKLSMEQISYVYSNMYKMKLVGMRFFTVYGPWGRPDMSLYKFTKKIMSNKKIDVFNFGDHYRSFTHVDDIVNNLIKLINKIKNHKSGLSRVVSIGNPKTVKLLKLIHYIEKYVGKKAKKNFLPLQKGDVRGTKAFIKKEIKDFNFKFNIEIEDGVRKFVKWFVDNKKQNEK